MTTCPGSTTEIPDGESDAPVRVARTGSGPQILPPIEVQITPLLSDWRELVRASGMQGLIREVAASSEVVELGPDHVTLRPAARTLVSHEVVGMIEEALQAGSGHPMSVRIADGERGRGVVTLSLIEEAERRAARLALIEAFKSDPFVQKCLDAFNGTVDETSVEPYQEQGKE